MIKLTQDDFEQIGSRGDAIELVSRIEADSEAFTSRIDPLDRARVTIDHLRSALIQTLTYYRKV